MKPQIHSSPITKAHASVSTYIVPEGPREILDERTSLGVRAVLLPVNLLELLHGRRHHVEAVGQEVLLLP